METLRVTPGYIAHLEPDEIFVFGSNVAGIHGAGAALMANEKFGAELMVGEGRTGQCYAIPTRKFVNKKLITCSLDEIEYHVKWFLLHALQHKDLKFLVTEIGCGYAGYRPDHIAPMFARAINIPNVWLPKSFWRVIEDQ